MWRGAPYTTPCSNSAPALALGGQARQHPRPRRRSLPGSRPAQCKRHLGTASPQAEANPNSGFFLPRRSLQALSAARGRATFPRSSAPAGSRVSYKHSLPDSSFSHHPGPSFSKMAASALPACVLLGCIRAAAAGATQRVPALLCCRDYNGDGGRTVWLEPGGSSPAPPWREPDGDATHSGPESALRYLGNDRERRQSTRPT